MKNVLEGTIEMDEAEATAFAGVVRQALLEPIHYNIRILLNFTFPYLTKAAKSNLLKCFSKEEKKAIAGLSEELRATVGYYGKNFQSEEKMKFSKINNIGELKNFLDKLNRAFGVMKYTYDVDLGVFPNELSVIGVESKGLVRFYLERVDYKRGRRLISISKNYLYDK